VTTIVLPDLLVWQAGVEFGLEAVAAVAADTVVSCAIHDRGPMVEAAAFAVHQLGLAPVVRFADRPWSGLGDAVVLAPRVATMRPLPGPPPRRLVTSDPALVPAGSHPVPARDVAALADALRHALGRRS
jgi:hypothetical protein